MNAAGSRVTFFNMKQIQSVRFKWEKPEKKTLAHFSLHLKKYINFLFIFFLSICIKQWINPRNMKLFWIKYHSLRPVQNSENVSQIQVLYQMLEMYCLHFRNLWNIDNMFCFDRSRKREEEEKQSSDKERWTLHFCVSLLGHYYFCIKC